MKAPSARAKLGTVAVALAALVALGAWKSRAEGPPPSS